MLIICIYSARRFPRRAFFVYCGYLSGFLYALLLPDGKTVGHCKMVRAGLYGASLYYKHIRDEDYIHHQRIDNGGDSHRLIVEYEWA